MRSVVYGALITAFLASAGTVQAANQLDGKALLCASKNEIHAVYGLVFKQDMVTRYEVVGYARTPLYAKKYKLVGTKFVEWGSGTVNWSRLNRENLEYRSSLGWRDKCAVSTKAEVFEKLDEIIAAAKKKNKF